jgi:hemolysin III
MITAGLIYSAGFVIYVIEKPNPWPGFFGFHEIWHVLVMGGALVYYLFVYIYVLPA